MPKEKTRMCGDRDRGSEKWREGETQGEKVIIRQGSRALKENIVVSLQVLRWPNHSVVLPLTVAKRNWRISSNNGAFLHMHILTLLLLCNDTNVAVLSVPGHTATQYNYLQLFTTMTYQTRLRLTSTITPEGVFTDKSSVPHISLLRLG